MHVCSDHYRSDISVEGVLQATEKNDDSIFSIATTLSNFTGIVYINRPYMLFCVHSAFLGDII